MKSGKTPYHKERSKKYACTQIWDEPMVITQDMCDDGEDILKTGIFGIATSEYFGGGETEMNQLKRFISEGRVFRDGHLIGLRLSNGGELTYPYEIYRGKIYPRD